ncbi:MAG: DUF4340 domain-containing protein, partial [Myxococcota bacterium]
EDPQGAGYYLQVGGGDVVVTPIMSRQWTIGLGVVAFGLLLFILFFEKDTLSSGELNPRRGRVFERFVRDRVTELTIERGEERLVLRREVDEEIEDEFLPWTLTSPVTSDTDYDAVDSLLATMEWAEDRRRLEDVSPADLQQFGIADSELRGSFQVASERVEFAFGAEDPQGAGYYLQVGGGDVVVVGQDLYEAFDHSAAHFRTRELFPNIGLARARSLSVERAEPNGSGSSFSVGRELPGRWTLNSEGNGFASKPAVRSIFDALRDLRIESYPDTGELGEPSISVRFAIPEDDGEERFRFRVGDACDDEEHRLAQVNNGDLVCVENEGLDRLRLTADDLRERRLLVTERSELAEAVFVANGGELRVVRTEDGFSVGEEAADPDALASVLASLREVEVADFLPTEDLASFGIGSGPSIRIVRRDDGSEEVRFGRLEGTQVYAQRVGENAVVQVPAAALDRIPSGSFQLRSRDILDLAASDIVGLHIVRQGVEERVERTEGELRVVAPVDALADRIRAPAAIDALRELTAESFIALSPAPEHGLATSTLSVTVRYHRPSEDHAGHDHDHDHDDHPPEELTIRFGNPRGPSVIAQADDGPIALVPASVLEAIAQPLVSRSALESRRSEVEGLTIEREGRSVSIRREDGVFLRDGQTISQAEERDLIEGLGRLSARRVESYGPPSAGFGFEPPRAVLTIARSPAMDPATLELEVGSEVREGEDVLAYVRRRDMPATFVVSADLLRPFLE